MTNTAVVAFLRFSDVSSRCAIMVRDALLSCALITIALLGTPSQALAVKAGAATAALPASSGAKGAAKETPLKLPLYFEPAEDGRLISRQRRNAIAIGSHGSVQFLAPGRKALEMSLTGAGESKPAGEGMLPGHSSYFLGNDRSKWRRDVSQYSRTRVPAVYPGIDLLYYGNGSALEHDYIVAPGANAGRIALAFHNGSASLEAKTGDLLLQSRPQEFIRMRHPEAYQQDADGARHTVAAAFERRANGEFGFSLGAYDHRRELVIDPVLIYSTFFGGSNYDSVVDLKTDASGNIYFLMNTNSFDLPQHGNPANVCPVGCGNSNPTGTDQAPDLLNMDYYVAKLEAYGQTLDFATYIGGSGSDTPANLALDADGNVYVAGQSFSSDFPTINAYQATPSLTNNAPASGTLTKLSADGSTLLYSTYIGYGFPDGGAGAYSTRDIMSVDKAGVVYLLEAAAYEGPSQPGTPANVTGPIKNSLYHEGVSFLAKIDTTQSADASLLYATLIGDDSQPGKVILPVSIGVDSLGDLWMYGLSGSTTFPVTTAASYQSTVPAMNAGGGAFLMELNPGGTAALYGTWLAGSTAAALAFATPSDMTLDSADNIYVTGRTSETDYPLKNAAYGVADFPSNEFEPFYVSKLGPGGTQLLYSTFYNDYSVSVGQSLNFPISPFVHGTPTGPTVVGGFAGVDSGFPTKNSLPAGSGHNTNNTDGVFSVFDSTKTGTDSLLIASVLGSSSGFTDVNQAVIDGEGAFVVLGGLTSAADFPVASPYQGACNPQDCTPVTQSYESTPDGFLMRVQVSGIFGVTPTTIPFPSTAVGSTSAPMTALISNGTTQAITLTQMTSTDSKDFQSTTDCGDAIQAFSSCTVTFTFTPKTGGALTSTFAINSAYSMASPLPLQVALSGTGTASAVTLSVMPSVLGFDDTAAGSKSTTKTATLTNLTTSIIRLTTPTLTPATDFSISANTCAATGTIAPKDICTFTFTFNPASAGAKTATFSVADINDTASPVEITLSGDGTAAVKPNTVTPNSLNFMSVPYQTRATQTVTFTNNGVSPVTLGPPQVSDPTVFADDFDGTCVNNHVVPAGGSCTYNVIFIPEATQNYTGTFTVVDGITNPVVTLAGVGVAATGASGGLIIKPSPINIANIVAGQFGSAGYTLTNTTSETITLLHTFISTGNFSIPGNGGCTAYPADDPFPAMTVTLEPGASCSDSLYYSPQSPDQHETATLSFAYEILSSQSTVSFPVIGNSISGAQAVVAPLTLQFPATPAGKTSSATTTVSNTGEASLPFVSANVTSGNTKNFSAQNNCGTAVKGNSSCTVTVTFAPDTSAKEFTALLDIQTGNTVATSDITVPLNGGTSPLDFVISSNTQPVSGNSSGIATWAVNVSPLDPNVPWNQPVTFTSDLDPSIGKVTFSPEAVTPGAKTVSTTATLTPPSGSSRLERPLINLRTNWPILACCVFLFSFGRRFRLVRSRRILLTIAFVFLGIMSARAKSSSPPSVTFNVTATSGSVSHTVELTYQPN